MRRLQGVPVSAGIGIGPAWVYKPEELVVDHHETTDPDSEWLRFQSALNLARNQLVALEERAKESVGEQEAAIFSAHQEFLTDVDLLSGIHEAIFVDHLNSEAAVKMKYDEVAKALTGLEDPYLKARSQDVEDVANRILRCLQGESIADSPILTQPAIILADDLTPSDTVRFDRAKILGICTSKGGPTSHTAILARGLGVPAVVNAGFDPADIGNGTLTIVDGTDGTITLGPTLAEVNSARVKLEAWNKERQAQVALTEQPAVTRDGQRIEVGANIGGVDDAKKAIELGADGVGLFRTEFLYLDRTELLSIDEQVAIYRGVVEILGSRPLVVRTLDIGGDKNVPYLGLTREANPFLGWRGIRMIRERPDLLANQFEALLKSGVGADLRVMLPMVSGVGEVVRAREAFEDVWGKLKARGEPIADSVQFGIMVEVPSAALLAEHLAQVVDFFSIGTNDLTQYTMAVDRTNERVAALASPYNPAVLKLISLTIDAAHKYGKWVGMCGELAGDVSAVPVLLGLGLDELSMAPSSIPGIKQAIRSWSLDHCKEIAQEALKLPGSSEVIQYLKDLQPA